MRRRQHRAPASADQSIEAYPRTEGCTRVRMRGRNGWLRVLDGCEEKLIIMDKELS
jgi:hypothetical protein